MHTEPDHLVVLADTLAQGAAWCEATLGVAPGPGGRHPLMGTHNRLLRIDSPGFPRAYLEILAIDPDAPHPGRARWFGLDDAGLQAAVRQTPRLVHAVLRTPDVAHMRQRLLDLGTDPGEPIAAQRDTPQGLLSWRILVRDDGAIAHQGALPTLIQWQDVHPSDAMPASPVQLQTLILSGLPLPQRTQLHLRNAAWAEAGPAVTATLQTPRGLVTLHSALVLPDPH